VNQPTSNISLQGLHSSPAAGFEQPFEMLQACHERVERMLRLLQRLRAHLRSVGCDEQARQAARDIMRYFDQAAPAHHEDEERHVFPALRAAGELAETVDRLQREHREMSSLWLRVRELLARVEGAEAANGGTWQPFSADEEGVLVHYAALYEWHLAAENELVYPAAALRLNAAEQAAMGEEMSVRRGVAPR
jgi:hemerythrin-like domain-containing protein